MNREILFRGKCVDNGEWIEGNLLTYPSGDTRIAVTVSGHKNPAIYGSLEFVIPETVGQYTGLTDKNGKKIFEGDILSYTDSFILRAEELDHIYGVVKFGEYKTPYKKGHVGFYIDWDLTKQLANFFKENASRVEVIGNIHDNPELLEVSE